jgi:hypothetical protein
MKMDGTVEIHEYLCAYIRSHAGFIVVVFNFWTWTMAESTMLQQKTRDLDSVTKAVLQSGRHTNTARI